MSTPTPAEFLLSEVLAALMTGPGEDVRKLVADLASELEKHRAFVAALYANAERDICPACSYLFRECTCGVGLEAQQ